MFSTRSGRTRVQVGERRRPAHGVERGDVRPGGTVALPTWTDLLEEPEQPPEMQRPMDRPPGLLLIERDSAGCPVLRHDDWGDGLRELIADRGTSQQPVRDQLAEHAREVVDRADGGGDGAPQRDRIADELSPPA